MKPRILLISNMYPGHGNRFFGIFVKAITDALTENGCDIVGRVVISGRDGGLLMKCLRYLIFYSAALRSLTRGGYDIVYGHYVSHVALPLFVAKKILGKKIIVNVHGTDVVKTPASGYNGWLARSVMRGADLIVAPSVSFKKNIISKYDLEQKKLFVSPSGGVDKRLFHPPDEMPSPKSNMITIGFVSRIDAEKGWAVLLEALATLTARDGETRFKTVIIGDGDQRQAMLERIDSLNLREQVEFLGVRSRNELPELYRGFDVFAYPTMRESLGLVGIEAMACGVPVIASRIPPLEEYVKDGINGYFFEVGDGAGLADKIEAFASLPRDKRQEMRLKAAAAALAYERTKIAAELKKEFDRLLACDIK